MERAKKENEWLLEFEKLKQIRCDVVVWNNLFERNEQEKRIKEQQQDLLALQKIRQEEEDRAKVLNFPQQHLLCFRNKKTKERRKRYTSKTKKKKFLFLKFFVFIA